MGNILAALLYYLFLIPISLLPFRVMYFVSDVFFFIIYYIFPYRKKLVEKNLRNSFPDKTEKEIAYITKEFYKHFCDIVFETLKVFTRLPPVPTKSTKISFSDFTRTQRLRIIFAIA